MAKKCQSRKKNGDRCSADVQSGSNVCVFHDPTKTAAVQKARQAGGINRTRVAAVLPSDTPDHPLGNTQDVADLLADSINRLRRGQLDPRVANATGYLASVLLRALEQGPMEERLAHLESILGKTGMGSEVFNFHLAKEVERGSASAANKSD